MSRSYEEARAREDFWYKVGITSAIAVAFGVIFGGILFSSPSNNILNDEQMLRAKAGASEFAEKAGMKLLSCYGKDYNEKDRSVCTLRTYHGTYEYLHCTYDQLGCVPATYKD